MKKILFLVFLVLLFDVCHAQFLKKLSQKAKEEVDYRVQRKAGQKIDQGLDSLLAVPKKVLNKNNSKENNSGNATEDQNKSNVLTASENNSEPSQQNSLDATVADENDMSQKDGYVTLSLSTINVFAGGSITFSGESVLYKNYKQVEIIVSGRGIKDSKFINLSQEGKYEAIWNASDKAENFTVTVKGSDKKSSQSAQFAVYELPGLNNWCDENIAVTNKAFDKLKEEAEKVSSSIGSKDKAELDNKMIDVKEKVNSLLKLYTDLNTAGKQVADLAKSGKNLSPNLADNLSELNNTLVEPAEKNGTD